MRGIFKLKMRTHIKQKIKNNSILFPDEHSTLFRSNSGFFILPSFFPTEKLITEIQEFIRSSVFYQSITAQ
jgi:hypothetical protein